jgi:hypothetical protein
MIDAANNIKAQHRHDAILPVKQVTSKFQIIAQAKRDSWSLEQLNEALEALPEFT